MTRISNLNEILFPVEERPIFASVQDRTGERRLAVPDKKAIVNVTNLLVLGIVSRSYRLVTNQEALELGFQCARALFPEARRGEWEVKVTDAPATGGHCHFDLLHNSNALDFTLVAAHERPEAFGPFVRVANSYNGLRALAFAIGFFRKVCANGLILPETIIEFKFTHLNRDIGKAIHFEVAHDRLAKLRTGFGDHVAALRACRIRREEVEPLVLRVLAIRLPKLREPNSSEFADWSTLSTHIAELCGRYTLELGENGYAVFNAITEFASHPRCRREGGWN